LQLFIPFLSAFCVAFLLTPLIRRLAFRFKVFATPNGRTVHAGQTPQLGGVAIYLAFTAGVFIYGRMTHDVTATLPFLVGGSVAMLAGLLDDLFGLNCWLKLAGQTIAAVLVVLLGVTFHKIFLPLGFIWEPGVLAAPLTVLWIVSVMNAVNLLDGLDGLAAGFAIIVGMFLIGGALIYQHVHTAVFTGVLILAAGGFIRYNFYPAKIFMGDAGSLFLGFSLAVLALQGYDVPGQGVHVSVLLVLFFMPLIDTAIAIVRRISLGLHPFTADRKHLHHKLLKLGLRHRLAVLALYSIAFSCGMASLIMLVVHVYGALMILLVFLTVFLVGLYLLGCFRFREAEDVVAVEKKTVEEPVAVM